MGIVGGRFLLLEVVISVEMDAKSSSVVAVAVAVRRLGLGGGGHEANNINCWVEDGGCLGVKRWAAVDDIIMLVELVFVGIECVLYLM